MYRDSAAIAAIWLNDGHAGVARPIARGDFEWCEVVSACGQFVVSAQRSVWSHAVGNQPLTALASVITASPGGYAILVGSGVSRSSGIPTGYEIALDLIGKAAAAEGATEVEPLEWLADQGEHFDYSSIVEALAVPGHQVGVTRLMGGPPMELWLRS